MGAEQEQSRRLVERLLRHAGLSEARPPNGDAWNGFLAKLRSLIGDLERDRYLLERSLDMSMADMAVMHGNLQSTMASLNSERAKLAAAWQRQQALAVLGRRAIEGAPVADMQRACVELAASALRAPIATIFELLDGQGLQLRADVGWPGARNDEPIPISPDSQARFIVDHPGGSATVNDYSIETRFTPAQVLLSAGVRSSVSQRVGSATDPFGIVSVHSDVAGYFNSDDELFVAELAHVLTLVIERDRHAEWLAHKAFHDDLTGLPNRALLRERIENALERSLCTGATVTLLLFDLDGFKMINDSRGHAAGDRLLTDVARRLDQSMRECDTPARIGGDEFAVLLDNGQPDEAVVLAERLLHVLRGPFMTADGEAYVRASIGIANNIGNTVDADELFVRADLAMYAAKSRGSRPVRALCPGHADRVAPTSPDPRRSADGTAK